MSPFKVLVQFVLVGFDVYMVTQTRAGWRNVGLAMLLRICEITHV
jgi:hypothetical protein